MNTIITSKEAILDKSKQLVAAQGWSAVSIRNVAAACGVSVGSIYNYFASKSDLITATVESIWYETASKSAAKNTPDFLRHTLCTFWRMIRRRENKRWHSRGNTSVQSFFVF